MGSHKVFIDMQALSDLRVRHDDIVFRVYREDRKFGELRISGGAVVWYGAMDKKGRKMTWTKFDALMRDEARRSEQRRPGTKRSVPRSKRG